MKENQFLKSKILCHIETSVFFFLREKKNPFREKTEKSAREKQATPVKKTQKVPVKSKSYPWKTPEKQNFNSRWLLHG